jgi:hypothetical protein
MGRRPVTARVRQAAFDLMPVRTLCEGAKDGVLSAPPWVLTAMHEGRLLVSPEAVRVQLDDGTVLAAGWRDYVLRGEAGAVYVVRAALCAALFEMDHAA